MQLKKWFLCFLTTLCTSYLFAQHTPKIKVTDIESLIARSNKPLVINFWATYCLPCIAEMPYFENAAAKYKAQGLEVLFVSLDMEDAYPARVDSFVAKRNLQSRVLWLDETNADYFCPRIDPKWSGAIPATLFVNKAKGIRRFLEQELTEDQLNKEIMAILK